MPYKICFDYLAGHQNILIIFFSKKHVHMLLPLLKECCLKPNQFQTFRNWCSLGLMLILQTLQRLNCKQILTTDYHPK